MGKAREGLPSLIPTFTESENGVANGTRTRNSQNHNLELYH